VKAALDWVKSNWLIVVMMALVILLPVGGIIGSGVWHEGIISSVEEEYQAEKRRLSGAQRVNYVVPAITPDGEPIELSREPNAAITGALAEERNRRLEQVEQVIDRAVVFNRGEHEPLVNGLFGPGGALAPATGGDQRQGGAGGADTPDPRPLLAELRDVITGAERRTSAYASLFDSVNAGTPPDAAELVEQLEQRAELERSKIEGQPTPEQERQITETLRSVRLARYRSAANRISVYGTPRDVLGMSASDAEAGAFSEIPLSTDQARPEPAQAFVWQWDYWIIEDLMAAVREANTGPTGLRVVPAASGPDGRIISPGSTVKRLESVRIERIDLGGAGAASGPPSAGRGGFSGRGGRGRSPAGASPTGSADSEGGVWANSYTGRSSAGSAGPYDVRRAKLVGIVAADRVDELVDAITAQNLMTVIGLEVEAIDPWEELEDGYFYGPERVVRVRMDIETAWLRAWTAPLMPPQLRTALGVPAPRGG